MQDLIELYTGSPAVTELEQVMNRYKQTVYGLAVSHLNNRAEADDIFQEVFLTYHTKAPGFESEAALRTWLIRTTLNLCKRSNHSPWNSRVDKDPDAGVDIAVQFRTQTENEVYAAVLSLDPKYRIPVYLFYFEGLNCSEIAKAVDATSAAVMMRLSRARKLLRERLEGDHFE